MKTFTNTHTLLYHTNDSISIPLRYSIIEALHGSSVKMLQLSVVTKTPGEL